MSADVECSSNSRLRRRYANCFAVGRNRDEAAIDMGRTYGDRESIFCLGDHHQSRCARSWKQLLRESFREFEHTHEIPIEGRHHRAKNDSIAILNSMPTAKLFAYLQRIRIP